MTPAAPASRAGDPEGATLLSWAAGGAILCGAADLLGAVLFGLAEPEAVRALAPAAAGAAFVALAAGAAALRGTPGALGVAAAVHVLAAAGGAWMFRGRFPLGMPALPAALLVLHGAMAAVAVAGAAWSRGPRGSAAREGARPAAATAVFENFESIVVAVAFALVIRHFAVEAYKIPTASMEPTLLGDRTGRGPGDRVLVSKATALFGGPGRWQIWVFRPPAERVINYVKRVVGLPGETVEIRGDGDVYVDGKVARKPPETREATWFPVYPPPPARKPASAPPVEEPWSGEGFAKDGDAFRVTGAQGRRLLSYGRRVTDSASASESGNAVGDVRISARVEDAEPGTRIVVRLVTRAGTCEAEIDAATGAGVLRAGGREAPLAGGGKPGRVEVSFADLLFEARVDGRVAGSLECEPARPAPVAFSAAIGVLDGGARFRGLRLDRDAHYTGGGSWTVPEGCYFFLGDNSANSEDSRAWRLYRVRETAPGGRTFWTRRAPRIEGGRVTFVDTGGVLRDLAEASVEASRSPDAVPFVPAADLHGRAFAIFWPPRWFTHAGGRVRFLP